MKYPWIKDSIFYKAINLKKFCLNGLLSLESAVRLLTDWVIPQSKRKNIYIELLILSNSKYLPYKITDIKLIDKSLQKDRVITSEENLNITNLNSNITSCLIV